MAYKVSKKEKEKLIKEFGEELVERVFEDFNHYHFSPQNFREVLFLTVFLEQTTFWDLEKALKKMDAFLEDRTEDLKKLIKNN